MSIKRYVATKDNTIATALKANLSSRSTLANMGSSDILEVFSIYGQASTSSLEQSRLLVFTPVNQISSDRDSGVIPDSGSVSFKLRLFNAEHGQTTPEKYNIISHPLLRNWNEGAGLDMESYLDLDSSNWFSASFGNTWFNSGGDYASPDIIHSFTAPLSYSQFLDIGTEDLSLDITSLVEEWLKDHKGQSIAASGSIIFKDNPTQGNAIKIYTHEGDYRTFQFSNTSGSTGKTVLVKIGGSRVDTCSNLVTSISTHLGSKIAASIAGPAGVAAQQVTASLIQRSSGFYGNTIFSSSVSNSNITLNQFSGGSGAKNYGVVIKLSGSFEDGTNKRSYYTKKFFARSSHHFFKKPVIEAQYDTSIKDDRSEVLKSSSLAPAEDNINNIYLYNTRRNKLVDIPNTGSYLVVQLHSGSNAEPENLSIGGGVVSTSLNYITASKATTGIYKASFAYVGEKTKLLDVWSKQNTNGTYEQLYTGSFFEIKEEAGYSHYDTPSYVTNITNLKPSYNSKESAVFRLYTKDKNLSPNVYTVASKTAPVSIIRDAYYKVVRVTDNFTIIPYTTASIPSYSSLSYDVSGSYFDLDMSILEPNYLYEISFLYKEGTDFIEQEEKFKFRVDP